jgi:adenylosuccinate synthase
MANRCVVGAQWGDEGKGKIVDVLSESVAIVARYSGGANAGHTVNIEGETFALHLIPTGVLHPQVTGIIGNGMVLDLAQLFAEIDGLRERGVSIEDRLKISTATHVVMPYHKVLEKANELRRGVGAIGTTMRGIGPAYADKVSRQGVRTACLLNPDDLRRRVALNAEDINRRAEGALAREGLTVDGIVEEMLSYAPRLGPMLGDTARYLHQAWHEGQSILLEGAQGALLDIDFGTYPYATSSNNTIGGAFTGLGIPPRIIESYIGVTKAYATRVGNGPFPTEQTGDAGEQLRAAGNEFGTTTGRPRRCGWLDLVALRYAVQINGLDYLAITKLDVLDRLAEIPVGTSYQFEDREIDHMPPDMCALDRCRAKYTTLPGWPDTPTAGLTTVEALPGPARDYLAFIEKFTGAKVGIISTGPSRRETIICW